jgi:hypothetical protein
MTDQSNALASPAQYGDNSGTALMESAQGKIDANNTVAQVQDALSRSMFNLLRRNRNANTRFNWYWGQSVDGRRHSEDLGHEAFPFENAPDTRPLTSDDIINDDMRLVENAFLKAQFAEPAGVKDAAWVSQVREAVQWMTHTRMMPDILNELKTMMNFRQCYGAAATYVGWDQTLALEEKTVSIEEFFAEALQAQAGAGADEGGDSGALMAALVDPEQEKAAVAAFIEWQPGVERKTARQAVRDLRETGEATFNAPYVAGQKAVVEALEIQYELVVPSNCRKLQDARFLCRRMIFTEAGLRAEAEAQGWSEAWVEAVLKNIGVTVFTDWQTFLARNGPDAAARPESLWEQMYNQYEVWMVYVKRTGENGQQGVFYNVIHANVTDRQAWKEDKLLNYAHGKYPFVEHRREWFSKLLLESRGAPEVIFTQQDEIKIQRDARAARASMDTMPPILRRLYLQREKLRFGPATISNVRDPATDIRFLEIPPGGTTSRDVEAQAQNEVDQYFGRARADGTVAPEKTAKYEQALVNDVFAEVGEIYLMIWQLMCQFMTQAEMEAVAGRLVRPWPLDNDEIRREHSLLPTFDVRENNPDYAQKKMEAVSKVAAEDPSGSVDYHGLTKAKMMMIDPNLARQFVKDGPEATQKEVEDEQTNIVKMSNGIAPQMKDRGVNAQLRLQTIQQTIANSPELQGKLLHPQNGQTFRQLLANQVKHYQFMLTQQNNRVIGRLGVEPGPLQVSA